MAFGEAGTTRDSARPCHTPGLRRGVAIVVAAPSGAGKSTICRRVIDAEPEADLSVSVTTRAPRPGEQDGVDYQFVKQDEFDRLARKSALLEWARVFGRSYGTRRDQVEARLRAGRDVLLDIDWQGWRQVRAGLPKDVIGVFVLPPDVDTLEARLRGRGQDSDEEIARRMAESRSEMRHWQEFDHVLVNRDLDECVSQVLAILRAARSAGHRWPGMASFVQSMVGEASAPIE